MQNGRKRQRVLAQSLLSSAKNVLQLRDVNLSNNKVADISGIKGIPKLQVDIFRLLHFVHCLLNS